MVRYFEPTMQERNWLTVDQFVKEFNQHRLANPQRWIGYVGNVCGRYVKIKNFGLWLQILTVEGMNYGRSCEARTVAEWKTAICEALKNA